MFAQPGFLRRGAFWVFFGGDGVGYGLGTAAAWKDTLNQTWRPGLEK